MRKMMLALATCAVFAIGHSEAPMHSVPLDSIILSDPAILADDATQTYYMTGTGGKLWKSSDLKLWEGPYDVIEVDTSSWMGCHPMVWAAELHSYKGRYYYFATFTNDNITIGEHDGEQLPRRASHVLASDSPMGPYRPISTDDYLPADKTTLDGTFWVEPDGTPYMVYCWEWLQQGNGTVEAIELKPDLSGTIGEGKVLFRASDAPWNFDDSRGELSTGKQSEVTDGPYLFRTATGRLGMVWTSWKGDIYCQGVAYSESGSLEGPWVQEAGLITPLNFGHGMLFQDFSGRWLMSVHSHRDDNGRYVRVPHLFEADLSGDKLKLSPLGSKPKPYDESIDPMAQIDQAVARAKAEGKHVICQVGGNWCRWCLMLADFVESDEEVAGVIANNYVYIHVNYPRDGSSTALLERLGNPGRFGYPALTVLDADGKVIHIQDSSYLEEGDGYDRKKVLRFLQNWVPAAISTSGS